MRHLSIVLLVTSAARLGAWLSLPLIVTNDGAFYLTWASELAQGIWPDLPTTRTPGSIIFLAGVFVMFGESANAVAAAQHALGVLSAACVWHIGRRIAGPGAGIAAGLLVGLDPWAIGFASYALAESLSVSLILASLAAATGSPRGWRLVVAGMLAAAAVLTRPAMLAWVPGVLVVSVLAGPCSPRLIVVRLLAPLLGITIALAPWLAHNAQRGVSGIVETDGLALWGGLARTNLLDSTYPVPAQLDQLTESLLLGSPPESVVMGYYAAAGRVPGLDRAAFLSDWARESLRHDPAGYAHAAMHAAFWQSNAMLPSTPRRQDETRWMMRRLGGTDAPPDGPPNLATSHQLPVLDRFHDSPASGAGAWLYSRWPLGMFQCFPHLPAGLATLAVICVCLYQKRWQAAAVLASSLPIVLSHALLLQPFSRYSLSAWMVWWIGAVMLTGIALPYARGLVRHPVLERGEDDPSRSA